MRRLASLLIAASLLVLKSYSSEHYFTYTYEPETMPQGGMEYEQTITARIGRNRTVGQENFNLWELRQEIEYGVSDNYTLALYLNESLTNFRDPGTSQRRSDFEFDGVSLENRYLVWNPVNHAVGLALYVEPRIAGDAAELEQKIILGQRYGDWKWALNLTHATEWKNDFHDTEGEVELSFGLTRRLDHYWSLGLEARDHNELPEYSKWENTAFYFGPVATYQRDLWWATLTVMPQLFGVNFSGNADGNHHLELEGHERYNVRLIVGVGF